MKRRVKCVLCLEQVSRIVPLRNDTLKDVPRVTIMVALEY